MIWFIFFADVVAYTGTSSSFDVTVLNGKRQSIYNSHWKQKVDLWAKAVLLYIDLINVWPFIFLIFLILVNILYRKVLAKVSNWKSAQT